MNVHVEARRNTINSGDSSI